MENTTIVGKEGTPIVVTTGEHGSNRGHGYGANDTFNTWVGTNETHRTGTAVINAVTNAENVISKGVYDSSVAGIKQTTDAAVSTTKTVTDYGIANADTTNRNATAVTKAITDASLAAGLSAAEIRALIATVGTANAIASKDIEIDIYKDGSHTREKEASHFAALQLDICKGNDDLKTEMLKGFAETKYLALENKCALAAQIAECCCEQKLLTMEEGNKTRALIDANDRARLVDEKNDLRLKLLLCGNSNNNGNGNGNGNGK